MIILSDEDKEQFVLVIMLILLATAGKSIMTDLFTDFCYFWVGFNIGVFIWCKAKQKVEK